MSGVLEGSNVKPVAAMSDMIASARRFEMQMKIISSVDENAGKANQVDELTGLFMISSLWIAKTGTDAQQTNMDVIANNGKRQHQWFQASARRFRRFALSNHPPAGRAVF